MIDFELYKVFYMTARCGSITQAAQQLCLTQPSVSKHIHTLEEALGCPLFLRSKRGVRLTAEGLALMSKLEPACKLIFAAEQELRSLNTLETGFVRIASTEMSFKSYVLPAMLRFRQEHPGVKVRFSNALNDAMIRMLETGLIDIAILHEPFRKEDFMELYSIEHMDEHLVCGAAFSHLADSPHSLQELTGYPFVSMPEGSSTMEYLRRQFSAQGLAFEPDITVTTVDLTVQAVENGLGLATLPGRIAAPLIEAGRMHRIELTPPLPTREVFVISNRSIPPSMAVSAFLQHLLPERFPRPEAAPPSPAK